MTNNKKSRKQKELWWWQRHIYMRTKFLPLGWWQSPTCLLSSQQIFQAWNHRAVRTWKHWKSSSSDYFSTIISIKIIKRHNNNQYFDDLRSMVELLWRMITITNTIFWNQHQTIKVFKDQDQNHYHHYHYHYHHHQPGVTWEAELSCYEGPRAKTAAQGTNGSPSAHHPASFIWISYNHISRILFCRTQVRSLPCLVTL